MRVAYVVRYWPALTETFVRRELAGLVKRGWSPVVFAIGCREEPHPVADIPDVPVFYAPRGIEAFAWRWRERLDGELRADAEVLATVRRRDWGRIAWLAKQLEGRCVEHVHVHFAGEAAAWTALACAVVNRPFSVTVHAVDLFKPHAALPVVLQRAKAVMTVCEHHAAWINETWGVVPRVHRMGVAWPPPVAKKQENRTDFVCVARPVAKKGIDVLIEAMRRLPDLSLRLVCDWPGEVPDNVVVGSLPPERVVGALRASEAFVLPCRVAPDGDRDGIPVAMMEAMACGLPVVTCAVAGIPELVDDQVGWWVPSDDPLALAHTLVRVRSNTAERLRKGRAAHCRIVGDGWTVARQVDEWIEIVGGSTVR